MPFYRNPALKNTKQTISDVPGVKIAYYHIYNLDATVTYLHLYSGLAANVTVGTTTPDLSLAVPASGWLELGGGGGVSEIFSFPAGLVVAATTALAGTGAPTNGLLANVGWR
jgi:hypothetical protein